MPGTTRSNSGLLVQALDRKIVGLDDNGYQTNPPYNTASYFSVSNDYRLTAQFNDQSTFSIRLYGSLPLIYDEWRFEPASLVVSLQDGVLRVGLWDGAHSEPINGLTKRVTGKARQLKIDHISNKLVIYFNDESPVLLSDQAVLRTGQMWLGLDASQPWELKSFEMTGLNNGTVNIQYVDLKAATVGSGLKDVLGRSIGAAAALEPLIVNEAYRSALLSNFNLLIPENAMKPQFLQPKQGTFVFMEADQLVDFANQFGMKVHGHTLVFSEANPSWMAQAPIDQRQAIMVDHITNVMMHFKGRVAAWDVVNEPLSDDNDLRKNIWYQAMGDTYIARALQAARAADPSAQLFINEYGLEANGARWQAFLDLLDKLQSAGVPIDGIGFQSHIYDAEDEVDSQVLKEHLQLLHDRGLVTRISELDVHGEDRTRQSQQYQAVVSACLSVPSCQSISTWGVTDAYGSTTEISSYPLEYGDDLLWDAQLTSKKAYDDLILLGTANR
jgi:endo-1,4-beta-xylanase